MCGISGIITFNNKSVLYLNKIEKSINTLNKRGPDAVGIYKNNTMAIAHRRLSIIDTTENANQPFFDNSEKYVIVFNGEIFNFNELKNQKLSQFEINFKSHSDTEVLLYLLIYYGHNCLSWLSGFFSFVFYDIEKNEYLMSRDRFGKKPFIYFQDDEKFIFASEMKAILAFVIPVKLNLSSVKLYFSLNYTPPNTSIYQNVNKLKPGNYITIKNNVIQENSFYKTVLQKQNYSQFTYFDAQTKLKNLLLNSVQERMISDVPLGAFLSGGIDSSIIVALASKFTNKLSTFSIGYKNNPLFDETYYANLVAKKFNTNHHEIKLSNADFSEEVFNVLNYLDEPFADSSAIPMYILSKYVKKEVTVALSGDGADEVFGGYNKHKAMYLSQNKIIKNFKYLKPLLKVFPKSKNSKFGNKVRQLDKLLNGFNLSPNERYLNWCSVTGSNFNQPLFNNDFDAEEKKSSTLDNFVSTYSNLKDYNDFNNILLSDVNLVLPGDMLYKVDMMSMANSLEVRCPFLDYKVVDFAFNLPATFKVSSINTKKILKDSFKDILPIELYNRPKQGFEIPMGDWFRNEFYDYIFNNLLNKKFIEEQGIFSFDEILNIKKKLFSNNTEFVEVTIWALVVFQNWYKINFN